MLHPQETVIDHTAPDVAVVSSLFSQFAMPQINLTTPAQETVGGMGTYRISPVLFADRDAAPASRAAEGDSSAAKSAAGQGDIHVGTVIIQQAYNLNDIIRDIRRHAVRL